MERVQEFVDGDRRVLNRRRQFRRRDDCDAARPGRGGETFGRRDVVRTGVDRRHVRPGERHSVRC